MRSAHHVIKKEDLLDKTINLKKIIGKQVLSKGGKIIGIISQVRINPNNLVLQGILINQGLFARPLYIGKSYFSKLSHDAVILNIEVSVLLKGKRVIDSDGEVIGVVEKVLINPKNFELVGISIDKGFLRKGLSIGKNYIDRLTDYAVFLKIRVSYELKGKTVFDKDGKKIGKVVSIEIHGNKNRLKSVRVKSTILNFLSNRDLIVQSDQIDNVGENIILNVGKDSLKHKDNNNNHADAQK